MTDEKKRIQANKDNDRKYGLPTLEEEEEVTESTNQSSEEIQYFTE